MASVVNVLSLSCLLVFTLVVLQPSLAGFTSNCSDPETYEAIGEELASLGLSPSPDEFSTIASKYNLGEIGETEPECLRIVIRSQIATLSTEYPAEDVQAYLEQEHPDFALAEECEKPEEYQQLGEEFGALGPNPDTAAIEEAASKYPDLDQDDLPCRRVMLDSYRQAYKAAGFYDSEEGYNYINKVDPVGWIFDEE